MTLKKSLINPSGAVTAICAATKLGIRDVLRYHNGS